MSQEGSIAEDRSEYPSFYDDPGVLRVMYPTEVPYASRKKIYPYQVLGSYTVAGQDIKGMPPLSTNGMAPGRASTGQFSLYITYEAAADFARYHPTLTVTADVDAPPEDVELITRAFRVMRPGDVHVPMTLPASYIDDECGYLEIFLDSDQKMTYLHRDDFASTFKKMGLHVFIGSRGQVRFPVDKDGEIVWERMGKETMTDQLNFTVKPCGVSMADYKWRQFLDVRANKVGGGAPFHCKFKIGGAGSDKLCAGKNGCHKLLADCVCDTTSEGSTSAPRTNAREAANQRRTRAEEAQSSFAAKFRKKEQTECLDFCENGIGHCNRGNKCGYMHVGTEADWATITCGLAKRPSGACTAAPHCMYAGCIEITMDYRRKKAAGKGRAE